MPTTRLSDKKKIEKGGKKKKRRRNRHNDAVSSSDELSPQEMVELDDTQQHFPIPSPSPPPPPPSQPSSSEEKGWSYEAVRNNDDESAHIFQAVDKLPIDFAPPTLQKCM